MKYLDMLEKNHFKPLLGFSLGYKSGFKKLIYPLFLFATLKLFSEVIDNQTDQNLYDQQTVLQESVYVDETPSSNSLQLDLTKAINIALSAQRRLGAATNSVLMSEINLELTEADFDVKYLPKGDAGYIGGGKAGSGATLGGGIEIFKKFRQETRVSIFPSVMKAAHNFQSNLKTTITQPLLRGFGSDYALSSVRAAQY